MSTWYEKLGFIQNPFFLDPVPPDAQSMEKGFVNRNREKAVVENFVQLRRGKLIVFGRIGEGKSSLLNYVEYRVRQERKQVIKLEGAKLVDTNSFVEELLHQVELKAEELPKEAKRKLSERMQDLDIIELRKRETEKVRTGLEGRLSALVAAVTGKIEVEESGQEEKAYYIAPRMTKLNRVVSELVPTVFEEMPTVIVADNLEKTQQIDFRSFLTQVAAAIPASVLLVTTGSMTEVDSQTMSKCYEVFDSVLLMDSLDTVQKLSEFIVGRMNAYCRQECKPPNYDRATIRVLLDRTGGNLRETFRYCYHALQRFKSDIGRSMMLDAIKEVDAPRFAAMNEADRRTLTLLVEEPDCTVNKMTKTIRKIEGRIDPETVRLRLENLVNLGFASKKMVKSGRTYVSQYRVPETLKLILSDKT